MSLLNRITLKTPESVELEFQLAGIGNRALALLIDNGIIWSVLVVVSFLGTRALGGLDAMNIQLSASVFQWIGAIALLLGFAWVVGYFAVFETLWQGQTPGKRAVKIRVIGHDGRPIQIYQATLRAVLRPLDDWLSLGFFFILFGAEERRLGDLLASTIVIQDAVPEIGSSQLPLSAQAQPIADKIQQTADLAQLLPDDFAIIREFLQRRQFMEKAARESLSEKLAQQVRERLQLESFEVTQTAEVWLEAVYLAYQQ